MRVLRREEGRGVAAIEQVRLPALLARFSEATAKDLDLFALKIAPLIESDRAGSTAYIEAMRCYFDAFGDYTAAAARLQIHPNTLRYRLRKAQELAGVSFDDAEERLA
ncbi:MAG: PucR family transcriptional regulator [Actinomycetota bacterium]